MLRFDPSERHSGKNPANLEVMEIPNLASNPDFYAGVTSLIKAGIGNISDASKAIAEEVAKLAKKIDKINDSKGMNAMLKKVDALEDRAVQVQAKRLMKDRCKATGVRWNADDKKFVDPKAEKTA